MASYSYTVGGFMIWILSIIITKLLYSIDKNYNTNYNFICKIVYL